MFNVENCFSSMNDACSTARAAHARSPVATALLAIPTGVVLGAVSLPIVAVGTVYHVAMTALSFLAMILTLGLYDKARENFLNHAFSAILLPTLVPLVILCVTASMLCG